MRNSGGKVQIEIEGNQSNINSFINDLRAKAPPFADIKEINVEQFAIIETSIILSQYWRAVTMMINWQLVPSDTATCPDCLHELFDENDRRFQYPFINCVDCGPRFTVINELPYDRQLTTMSEFKMCSQCTAEYEDPLSRRFHAQPNACFDCGPNLTLLILKLIKQQIMPISLKEPKNYYLKAKLLLLKVWAAFI